MFSGILRSFRGEIIEKKGLVFVYEMINNKYRKMLENDYLKVG